MGALAGWAATAMHTVRRTRARSHRFTWEETPSYASARTTPTAHLPNRPCNPHPPNPISRTTTTQHFHRLTMKEEAF